MNINNTRTKRVVRLNTTLFSTLGRVLGMSNTELMKATGISNATWYRVMGHPDEITVQQLISIANGLHIPVRRFFLYDDTDMVGGKDDYIENPYRSCFYNTKNLMQFIDTRGVATWEEVANELGMSRSNLRKSLLSVTRLPLTRFLAACEIFGIDPFCAIIDPNPLRVNPIERKHTLVSESQYESILANFAITQRELAVFRAEVLNVRRDIVRLEKKIDMIIDAHYEEIAAVDDEEPTAELTKQTVKEILSREDKQLSNNEVLSLPAL